MRRNRGWAMNRLGAVLLIMMLVLTGCGKKAVPPTEPPKGPVVVQKEKVPPIVDAGVPSRDPFGAGGSGSVAPKGVVPVEGRDPFGGAAAGGGWQAQPGQVLVAGRDPFSEGSGQVIVPPVIKPPEVPIEEPPVDVPVDPPVTSGVMIEVVTLDRCWLDVAVDNVRVLRTNVPVGETLKWQGQGEVRFDQVGRERAIQVKVNGKDLGRLDAFVPRLTNGSITEAGVQISLEKTYPGGVLVGLRFKAL